MDSNALTDTEKFNQAKESLNTLKSLINSDLCPQETLDRFIMLVDDISKNTATLNLSGNIHIFNKLVNVNGDSSSSSSSSTKSNLQKAQDILSDASTFFDKCDTISEVKTKYTIKLNSLLYRFTLAVNAESSQLTTRAAKPEPIQPTRDEMFEALSKETQSRLSPTLSSYSPGISGPRGARGSSGAVDATAAQAAALARAELFKELAGSIHDVVEDESISVQNLNTIANIDRTVALAGVRNKLDTVRQTIDELASNTRFLESFRPETLDALVTEMTNAPNRHLNNQVWKDRLKNLLNSILTRIGETGIGLVTALARFFSTTRDEFIDLMPATISAVVLAQVLNGISWMGAPMGTGLSLISANMSFTQSIFNALAGNAQRIATGLVSLNLPLVAPLVVAGLLLIVVSLLPQKYMNKLRNLVVNLLKAIRGGVNMTIRNATALLIYAIDRLYINRSQIFLETCRLAGSVGRGLATGLGYAASGAMNLTSGVASSAYRGAMSLARCLIPAEMLSITSTWMATQMTTLRASAVGVVTQAASQAVTTAGTAGLAGTQQQMTFDQLQTQLQNEFVQRYGITNPELSGQYQPITIATIDAQVSQDNNDIRTTDDELLDGALDSAGQTPSNTNVGAAIQQTASSRASSRAVTPSNSQDLYASPPPSPSPAYTPLNLIVEENNNKIKVSSYNEQNKPLLQTTADLTDTEESEDEGGGGGIAPSSSSSSKRFDDSGGGGGAPDTKMDDNDDDDDLDGGRRRKSYRRRPKISTKKKQYRRRTIRRLRNTRRRQKRNTKKKQYRRIRRR